LFMILALIGSCCHTGMQRETGFGFQGQVFD
jgi:hypothetical protein